MTHATYRYLLPMWDGGGTVAPELGVARRLIARGHTVHVLADPTIVAEAEQAGCTFTLARKRFPGSYLFLEGHEAGELVGAVSRRGGSSAIPSARTGRRSPGTPCTGCDR